MMNKLKLFGLSLICAGTLLSRCPVTTAKHRAIHWSTAAKITSPDRNWVVEVHPVFGEENESPVTVRRLRGSKSWQMFLLERDADLYWEANSRHVMVVNSPVAGGNQLLLFPVPAVAWGVPARPADALDRVVSKVVSEQLGAGKRIEFYMPALVSWKDGVLLFSAGGETSTGENQPFESFCYGIRVREDTLAVESVLSAQELKRTSGCDCEYYP
jgi:hypothetical protein